MELFNKNTHKAFDKAVETRRSIYHLEPKVPISDEEIENILKHTLHHVPSAFNSQTTRLVLLLGDEHKKLWDIVMHTLKEKMGPDRDFSATEQKINSFKAGYGTVLFYEDDSEVKKLQDQFTSYADKFSQWSEHTSGMHQFAIWTAFAAEGIGASLQHYNPLIDEEVMNTFHIPKEWRLIAEMPFGTIGSNAADKEKKPAETLMIVRK